MTEPFIGEIRAFGFNFAPRGWAQCNGQILPISQNTALFSLLGTFYGGDGKTTFALPNLLGRTPIHAGQGPGLSERFIGEQGGLVAVTLLSSEMATHNHSANADGSSGGVASPADAVWGAGGRGFPPAYGPDAPNVAMSPQALSSAGGNQPHNNLPPYQVVNFCIALQGIYPPRG